MTRIIQQADFSEDRIRRFWSYVDIRGEDECWPWTRSKTGDGYGQFYIGNLSGSKKSAYAHIFAFVVSGGVIKDGEEICHSISCITRLCCNPKHLRADTHRANVLDMIEVKFLKFGFRRKAKLYNQGLGQPQGERHPQAKLTSEEVKEIRESSQSNASLARAYKVNAKTISRIKHRQLWKHLK